MDAPCLTYEVAKTIKAAHRRSFMPHFFIHLRNQDSYSRDEEGEDLADLAAARAVAVASAGELIMDDFKGGSDRVRMTFFIENEAGDALMTLEAAADIGEVPAAA